MPSLTLKNVPESLLELLHKTAQAERRSANQEALFLIEEGLRRRLGEALPDAKLEKAAQVAAWERLAGRWISERAAADEVKAIIDARSSGRSVEL